MDQQELALAGAIQHPLLYYPEVADVLLDRVQMGFQTALPLRACDADGLCAALARRGFLASRPKRGAAIGRPLEIAFLVPLAEGALGRVGGQFVLATNKSGGLTVSPRSRLMLNPTRDLRGQLIEPGPKATDGADNLVWPYSPEWPRLLGLQLANVATQIGAVAAALAGAAGCGAVGLAGSVWVQHCEVFRDFAAEDAEAIVQDLADRSLPGAGIASARSFRERQRNLLCVAWSEGAKTSPERKVYSKRRDLVRTELAVRKRDAVKALLARDGAPGPASAAFVGGPTAELLKNVALAAVPLLDEVHRLLVAASTCEPRAGLDLVMALAPLIRVATPPPRVRGAAGRRASPGVPGRARHALKKLLETGGYDAKGFGSKDQVLVALRSMAMEGTLHAAPNRPRAFALDPALEPARRALSAARLPEAQDSMALDGIGPAAG